MRPHGVGIAAFLCIVVCCFPGKDFPKDAAAWATAKTLRHTVAATSTVRNNEDCMPRTFAAFRGAFH